MPFISGHTHFETPLTGSTAKDLIARARALGRTHVTYTDLGTLTGCFKAYKAATGDKKAPLKFIAGMEMMIGYDRGYYTVTVHAKDQAAYQALVRVASHPSNYHESKKTGDQYPTYSPEHLQELASYNVTFTLSGPHSLYARPVLEGQKDHAEAMIDGLLKAKPSDVYVSLVAASEDSVLHRYVRINGKVLARADLKMKTDYMDGADVKELLRPYHSHKVVYGFYKGGSFSPLAEPLAFEKASETTRLSKLGMGDAIKRANIHHLMLAKKRGIKVLVTDYAFMANAEDKIVQDTRSEGHTIQPSYYMMSDEDARSVLSAHGIPVHVIDEALANTQTWADQFNEFKLKYDWRLPKVTEENPKKYMMDIIRRVGRMRWSDPEWVARLKYEISVFSDNGVYDFLPYFFPISTVFEHYKEKGRLTGPGRGSVTGSLMAYVMGFTHINPLEYDLPFERFFSMDRVKAKKLPDVDIDLPDRALLVGDDGKGGLLYGQFGDKAAQISTRGMLRLKSAISDVNRVRNNGLIEESVKQFAESLPAPPQGVSDKDWVFGYEGSDKQWNKGFFEESAELQRYAEERPEEWAIVKKMLGIPRQHSRHASAFVIADVPVYDVIPTMTVNDTPRVTQYEAKEVEAAGLIKYDFLCLSQLIDIEGCLRRINARNGHDGKIAEDQYLGWYHAESDCYVCAKCCPREQYDTEYADAMGDVPMPVHGLDIKGGFLSAQCSCGTKPNDFAQAYEIGWFDHNGEKTYIWDLPKEDEKTAKIMADGHLAALFQVATNSMEPFVLNIQPNNIIDVAVILALVRPGPLDFIDEKLGISMAEKYVKLRKGEIEPDNPTLAALLPESYGVIVFQEQLTKIARNLAGMPGDRAEILRDNMCKKRKVEFESMKPEFMEGALKKASQEDCELIWGMMQTFGQYGFSINHATAYAAITWATAFLKAHYPLEYWASVLTNADNTEINEKLWKYVKDIVAPPDINLSTGEMEVDYAADKIRSKLTVISGLGDKAMEKVVAGRPYRDIEDFARKQVLGDAMTRKLIHVGVMDSLFPKDSTVIDKMQAFEDALEKLKYEEKLVEYRAKLADYEAKVASLEPGAKKPTKPREPVLKRGTIEEEYLTMSPYEDYSLKKKILPSMPSNLTGLVMEISDKVERGRGRMPVVYAGNGKPSRLVNGAIARLYEERTNLDDYDYFACAALIVSAKEQTMKKKKSKFLKLVVDTDGHMRELIKWADYNTHELEYPKGLKKGDVAFLFFQQKPGRPPRVTDILVEHSASK
jgi:DNA polymerase III alpha subunit